MPEIKKFEYMCEMKNIWSDTVDFSSWKTFHVTMNFTFYWSIVYGKLLNIFQLLEFEHRGADVCFEVISWLLKRAVSIRLILRI